MKRVAIKNRKGTMKRVFFYSHEICESTVTDEFDFLYWNNDSQISARLIQVFFFIY